MPRIYPTIVKKTTVVSGVASPLYIENAHLRDSYSVASSMPDSAHLRDAYSVASSQPDSVHVRDAYSLTLNGSWGDTAHFREAGIYTLTSLRCSRTGTPDADQMSDGWVDQASTGTNHGNESLQCKGASSVPGSDQKIAFLQVDLTRLSGVHAASGGGSLTFIASTSNALLATSLSVGFAVQASRWFTESTMTYATGRPTPSVTALTGPSIATGAAASYTVTFTQAQLNTMLGNWVIFQFTTAGGAVPDTVTILSRDNATDSNRPAITLAVTIP